MAERADAKTEPAADHPSGDARAGEHLIADTAPRVTTTDHSAVVAERVVRTPEHEATEDASAHGDVSDAARVSDANRQLGDEAREERSEQRTERDEATEIEAGGEYVVGKDQYYGEANAGYRGEFDDEAQHHSVGGGVYGNVDDARIVLTEAGAEVSVDESSVEGQAHYEYLSQRYEAGGGIEADDRSVEASGYLDQNGTTHTAEGELYADEESFGARAEYGADGGHLRSQTFEHESDLDAGDGSAGSSTQASVEADFLGVTTEVGGGASVGYDEETGWNHQVDGVIGGVGDARASMDGDGLAADASVLGMSLGATLGTDGGTVTVGDEEVEIPAPDDTAEGLVGEAADAIGDAIDGIGDAAEDVGDAIEDFFTGDDDDDDEDDDDDDSIVDMIDDWLGG